DDVYPVLKLTEKSAAVLKGLEKVELIATQTTTAQQPKAPVNLETELLDILKILRRNIANNEGVPPYIILSDATLVELATYLPLSLDEIRLISGFGDIKLASYGRDFLEPVKTYCAEKGLSSRMADKIPKRERKPKGENAAKRESLNGMDTAYLSYSLFRQGHGVAEIAASRGLAATTIESHL